MSRPKFRGEPTYFDSLGNLQVTKSATSGLNTSTTLISSTSGTRILIKAVKFTAVGNGVQSLYFITDATDILPLAASSVVNSVAQTTGWETLPGNGWKAAANTAVTLNTSANSNTMYQICVKYSLVDAVGSEG